MSDRIQEGWTPILSANRCQGCQRFLLTSSIICELCAKDTRQRLAEIPKLYAEASDELIPGRGGYGSSGSEMSIGVNIAALDFLNASDLLGKFWAWEQTVRLKSLGEKDIDENPIVHGGTMEFKVQTVCDFLMVHFEWLSRYEAAGDFVRDVADEYGKGMGAARRFVEKVTRIKCPTILEMSIDGDMKSVTCNHSLVLKEDIFADIRCRGCDAVWTSAGLIRVALKTPGYVIWMDSESIASLMGITSRYVRMIADEFKVKPRGKRGEKVYDLIEMSALREKMRHAEGA